jgi:hypothetical protein
LKTNQREERRKILPPTTPKKRSRKQNEPKVKRIRIEKKEMGRAEIDRFE